MDLYTHGKMELPSQKGQVELAESETGTETGAETGTGMDNQMGGVAALGAYLIILTFLLLAVSLRETASLIVAPLILS